MAWAQLAAMLGGGILKGQGAIAENNEQKGQNKQIGWIAENADELAGPVGQQLEAGYAPGGWYRNVLAANQAAEAEAMRARSNPTRLAMARRAGGIRSGAFGDRRGGWLKTLATAGLAGDLGGVRAGAGYDAVQRFRRLQELSSVPVGNPYALAGNAFQSAGKEWWNQGTNYTPTTKPANVDGGTYLPADVSYDNGYRTA